MPLHPQFFSYSLFSGQPDPRFPTADTPHVVQFDQAQVDPGGVLYGSGAYATVYPQANVNAYQQTSLSGYHHPESHLGSQETLMPTPLPASMRGAISDTKSVPQDARQDSRGSSRGNVHGKNTSLATTLDLFSLHDKTVESSSQLHPSSAASHDHLPGYSETKNHSGHHKPDDINRNPQLHDGSVVPQGPYMGQSLTYGPQQSGQAVSYFTPQKLVPVFLPVHLQRQVAPFQGHMPHLTQTMGTQQPIHQRNHSLQQQLQHEHLQHPHLNMPSLQLQVSLRQSGSLLSYSPESHLNPRSRHSDADRLYDGQAQSSSQLLQAPPLAGFDKGYPLGVSQFHSQKDMRRLFDVLDLSDRAKNVFEILLKEIFEVNSFNFIHFLVRMLRLCKAHIPLDDFYQLLNVDLVDPVFDPLPASDGFKIDNRPPEPETSDVMSVCHRVLEIFKEPKTCINVILGGKYEDTKLGSVNYHELLRSFLALKIIIDALVVANDETKERPTTQRLTIYKVYFILCQKLFKKYPSVFNELLEQKFILGPSKLGKLIKSVYPDISAKRLGRRGCSKYHYVGLSLNPDLVTAEVNALCDHEIEELAEMFGDTRQKRSNDPNFQDGVVTEQDQSSESQSTIDKVRNEAIKLSPPCSFIKPTCMFPTVKFSPVLCIDLPRGPKDQKSWFYQVRRESLENLIKLNVDMSSFIKELEVGDLLISNLEWLLHSMVAVLEKMTQLPNYSKRHYKLLFLFVVVWVFPLMLYLDISKSDNYLFHLRENIHNFVLNSEDILAPKKLIDALHLKSFIGILNKILNLDDVANSLFKAKRAPEVIKDMFEDISVLVLPVGEDEGSCVLERLFTFGLVDCMNAYQFIPRTEKNGDPDQETFLLVTSVSTRLKTSIVQGLKDLVKKVDSIQEQSEKRIDANTMRFEFCRICLEFCHESCFDDLLLLRFTVAIINSYLLLTSNQIMKFIFHSQNKRALLVLNTTFRHWWVVLSFLQEYCGVVLETVGIYDSLGFG